MNDGGNPGWCLKALLNVRRQKVKGSNIQIARGNLNAVVWNKRSRESRTKRISVYRRRMAANGSRRRNHEWRKKHGWDREKIKGQRENEGDGREDGYEREDKKGGTGGGYGEATEEKTRLHVTSSPEPIWSQSVFHYQKPRRALYQIVHSVTLVKLTGIPRASRRAAPGSRGGAHNWSSPVHTSRARAAHNFRRTRNKSTRGPRPCRSRRIFNSRKWIVCQS